MALADSEITITFGGERIVLRPSLRAAMRLVRQFDGFDNLLRGIAEQDTRAMSALIEECAEYPSNSLTDFLTYDTRKSLAHKLASLVEPLFQLVLALAGLDLDALDEDAAKTDDDVVPYVEHFERLFGLATGWLGWSPEDAWDATPAEITAAYNARVDMLKAIFGAGEEKPKANDEAAFAAFMRARAV
jgi:hypothetical protein